MSYEELKKKFDGVDGLFKQDNWDTHHSVRIGTERVSVWKTCFPASVSDMFIHRFDRPMKKTEVFAEVEKMEARVATAEELIRYADEHKDAGRWGFILALGSSILHGIRGKETIVSSPNLHGGPTKRFLMTSRVDGTITGECVYLLLVRKYIRR